MRMYMSLYMSTEIARKSAECIVYIVQCTVYSVRMPSSMYCVRTDGVTCEIGYPVYRGTDQIILNVIMFDYDVCHCANVRRHAKVQSVNFIQYFQQTQSPTLPC